MGKHVGTGLGTVILVLLWNCGSTEPRACTEMGCESGLAVEVTGDPGSSFTITLEAEGMEPRSVVCSEGGPCDLFFEEFLPSALTVTYQAPGTLVVRDFTPEYARLRPNGEGCPPECLQATVELEIPTMSANPSPREVRP